MSEDVESAIEVVKMLELHRFVSLDQKVKLYIMPWCRSHAKT
jgi:hypothetical protein